MGKGTNPTPDELEFVYQLICNGNLDTDILAKYEELKKHGKLGNLPFRQDKRFPRQRRKEYEAAKRVLERELKVKADPRLKKHRDDLAGVADDLFSNLKKIWSADNTARVVGNAISGGSIWLDGEPPPYHSSQSDREDQGKLEKSDTYFAQLLLEHLKQESSLFNEITDWQQITKEDISEEIMDILTHVAHGGLSDNMTCEMCKSWYE